MLDCRFDGWGVHDCDRAEAAGVRCKKPPPPSTTTSTTTPRPRVPIHQSTDSIEVSRVGMDLSTWIIFIRINSD